MTPEEAIEIIEKQIVTCEAMIEFNENFDPEEDNAKFLKEKEALLMVVQSIREVQQYRKIGTVEECREAVEKQKLKKPVKDKYNHNCCPNCGWIVSGEGGYGEEFCPHCENCGQAIDENLEGREDGA